jgi:hypothetical protein
VRTDLDGNVVRDHGSAVGLVDVKVIALDEIGPVRLPPAGPLTAVGAADPPVWRETPAGWRSTARRSREDRRVPAAAANGGQACTTIFTARSTAEPRQSAQQNGSRSSRSGLPADRRTAWPSAV